MIKVQKVENIQWSGGELSTYILLDGGYLRTDSIILAPTLYLLDMAKKGVLPKSIKAFSDDLKSYFHVLNQRGHDWRKITDQQMSGYLHGVLYKERQLVPKSINRHISTLKGFYSFAVLHGLLDRSLTYSYTYASAEVKEQGQSKANKDFRLSNQYIHDDIFKCVMSGIKTSNPFIRERDELVFLFGKLSGLRTHEVTSKKNLNTSMLRQLINEADRQGRLVITVPIMGKKNKLRHVDLPVILVNKIRTYLYGRRAKLPDGPLICSINGNELNASHATKKFKAAINASLVNISVLLERVLTEHLEGFFLSIDMVKSLSYHALRHTYATNLVDFCYKNNFDPWQYVPEQMGHEDDSTTKAYIIFDAKVFSRDAVRKALEVEDMESNLNG